jgi:hypothetical protein
MRTRYVIQWKSRANGRAGRGTKLFEWEDAELLAEELNREYPDIHHEVVDANLSAKPVAQLAEAESSEEPEAGSENPPVIHSPDHAFSFQ